MTTEDLIVDWCKLWEPRENLPLSEWAEKNFFLSPEYSNRTGFLRLYGWQKQIFDAFTDPTVSEIVLMCGTQLVKTLFVQVALTYVISEAPGPVLLLEPKDEDAKAFSKERLTPMARDIPCLHGKLAEVKSRDGKNTYLYKEFPGGNLSLAGAIVPGNMARRSIRYLFADEQDKYPLSAGDEGDPLGLARERLSTFRSRAKIIRTCSPTIKGRSRIAKGYEQSDQRKPHAACWKCGQGQVLKWAQVKWDSDLPVEDRALSAYYECEHCGAHWDDLQRWKAADEAVFKAARPFRGVAGFWISHLYSPYKRLSQIVKQFFDAKDDKQALKVFINTTLAELWEEEGTTPEWELLYSRREDYPCGAEPGVSNDNAVVPKGALLLFAGVDVQEAPARLEYEVVGFGRNGETWSVAYGVIQVRGPGGEPLPPTHPSLWAELDTVLMRQWQHAGGSTIPIMAMGVDTGSRPKPVYDFSKRHGKPMYGKIGVRMYPHTVVPVKGSSHEALRIIASISGDDAARKRAGVKIVTIGTGVAKQELYDNLRAPRHRGVGPAPYGYAHFPDYGESYFQGLCSEKRIQKENGDVAWEKQGRNEPLDCRVYARAMASLFGIDRFTERHWKAFEEHLGVIQEPDKPQAVLAPAPVHAVRRRREIQSFTVG